MSKRVKAKYRKIWEKYNNQKIPVGYHIHHIDGNRENNDPTNLMCLSAEDHHKLHLEQGDIVARYGKFIQGASEAGKMGGSKSRPRWEEGNKKQNLSRGLKQSYSRRGGSPLKGSSRSEEIKKKISVAITGPLNPMYGKTHSDKVKKRLSEIGKTKIGEKNNFYGKTHSRETKQKISQFAKTRTGEKNPMFGRSAVKELNLRWYTNGVKTIYVPEGSQPLDYTSGRKLKNDI